MILLLITSIDRHLKTYKTILQHSKYIYHIIFILVNLILFTGFFLFSTNNYIYAQTVYIPDSGLRNAFELALKKRDGETISQVEIGNLENLNAENYNIKDLTGLEHAIRLKELRLGNNRIVSLSPIMGLEELTILDIHTNWMKFDLKPLKNLTYLTWLSLRVNRISDLSPLKDLTKLTYLHLDDNRLIVDLSPLKGLINLRLLYLDESQISDVSWLKDLTNLKYLKIDDNKLSDITPLRNLKKLTYLNLNDNVNISDITPLLNMKNLKFLDLHGNMISDISTLAELSNLEDLRLQENEISDVFSLKDLKKLEYLDLHQNNITIVRNLKDLTNLKYLDLRENNVTDFSSIHRLRDKLVIYYTDNESKSVDVNRDGSINIADLVAIALNFTDPDLDTLAQMNIYPDVNDDGVVDLIDLLITASEIGTISASPTILKNLSSKSYITTANLTEWIRMSRQLNYTDPILHQGLHVLEELLVIFNTQDTIPRTTSLLPNYPNPFNPETWIPYQLAKPERVNISIHSVDGKLIRTMAFGQLPAGSYHNKSRAAYWDGRNEFGEFVTSGVYFYTLTTGDFSATGKMLIKK